MSLFDPKTRFTTNPRAGRTTMPLIITPSGFVWVITYQVIDHELLQRDRFVSGYYQCMLKFRLECVHHCCICLLYGYWLVIQWDNISLIQETPELESMGRKKHGFYLSDTERSTRIMHVMGGRWIGYKNRNGTKKALNRWQRSQRIGNSSFCFHKGEKFCSRYTNQAPNQGRVLPNCGALISYPLLQSDHLVKFNAFIIFTISLRT